ncbi:MAG: glycosyltransferase family protein [Azoarcus sp.]|jgi:GT2 family glycosyltransferase|nr:glycosyltransferase family protein [Azoarcus sp.]
MSASFFSVIVCSVDTWKFAQTSACYARLLAGTPFEIIGIHDALSLAEGYNRGLRQCRGDIVIFSHDDVLFLDRGFAHKIGERMQNWDLLGFAGSSRIVNPPRWFAAGWPHLHGAVCHWSRLQSNMLTFNIYGMNGWPVSGDIQTLDGLCLIARRDTAAATGFDDDTFDGWHLYDSDFSFAASLAGYKVGVCCDMPYIHASASIQTTENPYVSDAYLKYTERFIAKYRAEKIPECAPKPTPGVCIDVHDHLALMRLWNEIIFRRTTFTTTRRQTTRDSMPIDFHIL